MDERKPRKSVVSSTAWNTDQAVRQAFLIHDEHTTAISISVWIYLLCLSMNNV